jgi:serine/threonine-protein kinase
VTDLQDRLRLALADRYAVERELGQGGMATVYLAEDLKHARKVAIKVLREDLSASLGKERFLREIKVAAGLQHPHVLPLYDSGEADGLLFYVMPFVEGLSLRDKLAKQGELPIDEAVRILRDVADALSEAHRHGVVHRDLKPENVMLRGRHALVTDFGVAKALSEATGRQSLTTVGIALGTPTYMAPEQAVADPMVDHRADIYAFGVLGYELLSGKPPFTGMSPQQILAAHVTAPAKPIATHRSMPAVLASLVMRCLEKKPADRWQSAEALIPQLESLLTPSGGMTPTGTRPLRALRPVTGSRRIILGAGVMALALAAAAMFWLRKPSADGALDPNLIAILPFRVTSVDPSLNYLGEGMVDLLSAMYTGEGGARAIDPRTTLAAWKRHGGGDQAEAAGPAAARELGAGQYLLGSVVSTGARLVLSASVGQPGKERATAQARVEGPVDSLSGLLDAMVGQLLVRDAGLTGDQATGLPSSLAAIRAYVMGRAANRRGKWNDGVLHFARAIALDSSFTLAALGLTEASVWLPVPVAGVARVHELAWANRATLSPRDLALLAGYTGGNGPAPHSGADELRAWEAAVSRFPDLAEAWYWLGETYYHQGGLLGFDDHLTRADRAFEMASSLDPDMTAPLYHRIDMATMRRDTARARSLLAQLISHDSTSEGRSILELYFAEAAGDSAAMADALQRFVRTRHASVYWGAAYFLRIGRGLQWLDTLMSLGARAAGAADLRATVDRDRMWTLLDLGRPQLAVADAHRSAVWDDTTAIAASLYWSAPVDAALGAVQRQARLASSPAALTAAGRRAQYAAACLVGQWNLVREPAGTAAGPIGVLRRGADARDAVGTPEANPACLALLEAMQAVRDGHPVRVALVLRLDSLLLTVPPGTSGVNSPPDAGLEVVNLAAAHLLERVGLTAPAFRAARRSSWSGFHGPYSPRLRELGRLAVLAGERDAAVRAYRHYLAIRRDPEPALIPQRDSVRAELAALEGVP